MPISLAKCQGQEITINVNMGFRAADNNCLMASDGGYEIFGQ
jgi:hypothetical protein